ncbi:hypothetical protein [Roseomonas sp. BN140053]|uniref:hypothetical protein n=1 Tax=Roseomonas sp. BN140053 TaxID=3391898 RepID=UPI0039E7C7B3
MLRYEPLQRPPIEIPMCVGDAVHNLRAALDFLMSYVIAGATGDVTYVHFPLHDTRKNLENAVQGVPINKAPEKIRNLILNELDPCKTGNYALWALNRLDRIDKHNFILPMIPMVGITFSGRPRDPGRTDVGGSWYADCHLSIVATEPGEDFVMPQAIEFEGDPKPSFAVKFPRGGPFEDEPVLETLIHLAQSVSKVIDDFERIHVASGT